MASRADADAAGVKSSSSSSMRGVSVDARLLRWMLTVTTATAVALTFISSFVPSVGRATHIESFVLGALLFPVDDDGEDDGEDDGGEDAADARKMDFAVLSTSSALSVLVFLVTVFNPNPATPSVDINYIVGLMDILCMFVLVTWTALSDAAAAAAAAAATAAATSSPPRLRLICPLAACAVVAAGDVARVGGVHAAAFVFARCYRYAEPRYSPAVRMMSGALPLAVALWPAATLDLVGLSLVALSLLNPVLQSPTPFAWLQRSGLQRQDGR